MCCRRKQQQRLLQAGLPAQAQRLSCCAARRQRRELQALAVNSLPIVETGPVVQTAVSYPYWTEYQPLTMAGMLVMGAALGLQEGGKKIKEKRDDRKAKKAALVSQVMTQHRQLC